MSGRALLFRRSPLARLLCARSSSTRLFVGGLSYDTNETLLMDAFRPHGEIVDVRVICDHVNGESKCYGFVSFTSEIAAEKALKEMNGQLLDGRILRVHYAHKGNVMESYSVKFLKNSIFVTYPTLEEYSRNSHEASVYPFFISVKYVLMVDSSD